MCKFAENFPLKANLSQNLKRKITRFVVRNEKRGSVNVLVGSDVLTKCFADRTSMYNYNFEVRKSLGYC